MPSARFCHSASMVERLTMNLIRYAYWCYCLQCQIYLIYSNGSSHVFEGEQLMCRDPDSLLSYCSDEEMR